MLGRVQQQSFIGGLALNHPQVVVSATASEAVPTTSFLGENPDYRQSSITTSDEDTATNTTNGDNSEEAIDITSLRTTTTRTLAESPELTTSSSDVVIVTTDKTSKFDRLHGIRYRLEHNQLSRLTSEANKVEVFRVLNEHLDSEDWEVKQFAVQLIHDILPHVGGDVLDLCMAEVMADLVPCLGSPRISIRKAAIQALHIYLRFTSDIASVLKAIVSYGLEHSNLEIVHETLISIPLLFPEDFDERYCGGPQRNLFYLVSGLAKKLQPEDTRLPAFMSLQRLADVVGVKQFQAYLSKLSIDQKKIYEELTVVKSKQKINNNNDLTADNMNGLVMIHGRKMSSSAMSNGFSNSGSSWFEYGAIDDGIIEKLRDEEDVRVRLTGADELTRAVKSMKDLSALLPQMRLFLTFLDSLLEGESNFKMVLLVLETYGVLIDRMRHKVKPHLRSICSALLRHASNNKIVVRIENYRVVKKLMLVSKPNVVLNHMFDHLGDKRSVVREDVLNIVMYALLTFPSNEFDLKNIAATVVPTLVDPKKRVRQASQECVAILAAFMGPTKAAPLIRSIELLESHFERGAGVLNAVQARLSRRQLPRITADGLVEYSLQIPRSAMRYTSSGRGRGSGSPIRGGHKKYGADIEWILAGTGSISSGSAKSISTFRSESRLDESFSSSASFPNSPATQRRCGSPVAINGTAVKPYQQPSRSKSEESLAFGSTINVKTYSTSSRRSSALVEEAAEVVEASKKLPNLEGNGKRDSAVVVSEKGTCKTTMGNCPAPNTGTITAATSEAAELPRLVGTKSQASTASSSATRDSGISVNDVQKAAEQVQMRRASKGSMNGGLKNRNGSSKSVSRMISVDDLPISGRAMPLGKRPSTNRSTISNYELSSETHSSRTSVASSTKYSDIRNNYSRSHSHGPRNGLLMKTKEATAAMEAIMHHKIDRLNNDDVTPPRSPLVVQNSKHLLLRPADNSPFTPGGAANVGNLGGGLRGHLQQHNNNVCNQSNGASSTNSTPYSQISIPSSYDYEDDFTSESESEIDLLQAAGITSTNAETVNNRSSHSQRTVKSTNSSGSSRIPIKRNSSLRKKKNVMSQYKSGTDEEEPQTLVIEQHRHCEPVQPPSSPSKIPISQAEFDDMPLPASRSNGNLSNGGILQNEKPQKNTNGAVPVPKRPFLQRKSSPTKLGNNHSNKSGGNNNAITANRAGPPSSTNQFSRSPPSKRNSRSLPGAGAAGGRGRNRNTNSLDRRQVSKLAAVASSRTPSIPRTNRSMILAKTSSIHKSTPNLASTTTATASIPAVASSAAPSTPAAPITHSVKSKTPNINAALLSRSSQDRTPNVSSSSSDEATAGLLIDAVPEVPAKNKMARTPPPQMTRKMIAVSSEALDTKPKTPAEQLHQHQQQPCPRRPSQHNNGTGVVEKPPEADPIDLNMDAEQPLEPPTPSAAPSSSTFTTRPQPGNGTAHSTTAPGSGVSMGHLNFLPVKTQSTLKSPLEGHNLNPIHKPEEFLQKTLDSLSSTEWEANVTGLSSVVRLARHHPEYLLVEYKPLLQNVMKHVKNLRSQVCRAAAMVVGEMFTHLKRNMEPELEKVMLPLILKSGDTNKFLREDCNVALDAIVENSNPSKIILIVTSELVYHKSPVVRTTVSRILAYTVDRMGIQKALTGGKDTTDKLLPAIAKLAQDGSPDARNYAKSSLQKMLTEHPDFEKILKKSLTPNTMRNLEKIIDVLKNPHPNTGSNGFSSRTRSRGNRGTSRLKTL